MKYFETKDFTKKYRQDYLDSVIKCIPTLSLTNLKKNIKLIEKLFLSDEDAYKIYRVRFNIDGIHLSGVLFEINPAAPLVVMQHGLLGTPEVMSSMYFEHDSSNYNDITLRLLNLGVNVFAPQLMLWSIELYGVNYNRFKIQDECLKYGFRLVDIETELLISLISYFKDNCSYKYINMFGMSFGAMYTYMVADKCDDVKHYVAFSYAFRNYEILDAVSNDELAEIIQNVYKNKDIHIILGNHDPVICYETTNKLFKSFNDDSRIHIFNGEHEIVRDNSLLEKLI